MLAGLRLDLISTVNGRGGCLISVDVNGRDKSSPAYVGSKILRRHTRQACRGVHVPSNQPPINLRSSPLRSAAKLSQETEVNGRGAFRRASTSEATHAC